MISSEFRIYVLFVLFRPSFWDFDRVFNEILADGVLFKFKFALNSIVMSFLSYYYLLFLINFCLSVTILLDSLDV